MLIAHDPGQAGKVSRPRFETLQAVGKRPDAAFSDLNTLVEVVQEFRTWRKGQDRFAAGHGGNTAIRADKERSCTSVVCSVIVVVKPMSGGGRRVDGIKISSRPRPATGGDGQSVEAMISKLEAGDVAGDASATMVDIAGRVAGGLRVSAEFGAV